MRQQDNYTRYAAIPSELRNLHQWAPYGGVDKQPLNLDESAMKWGTRSNWLTFDEVSCFDKIGYFHTLESGVIGVDFDGCVDENGVIHPLVLKWILHTFAEFSPSERGIKAYFKGKLPSDRTIINKDVPWGNPKDHTGIEIYAQKRFFTVTGNIVPGCPSEINEAPEVLNDILVHFAKTPKPKRKESPVPPIGTWDFNAWVLRHLDVVEQLADSFIITCPWAHEHTTPGDKARIWEGPPHTFSCFHAHCDGREWSDVRLRYEPTAYDKRDAWSNTTTYSPGQDQPPNGRNGRVPQNSSQQPDLETIIKRLDENEYGDGLLFAEVFNGQVCYDHSEKAWYIWNKHHWKKDATGKIKQLVSGHLGSIYLKARGDIHKQMVDIQAETEQIQKENSEDSKIIKLKSKLGRLEALMSELEKRARALRGANRMKNVLTFAMSEHSIGITGEIWDSDPWLLGVPNGVINLHTGELRDGYPIDYIRSVSPTEWRGLNAQCPRTERFLQEIFADRPENARQDLISFLKRLFGYATTGLVSEHIFPIFYGEEGRNGKDTLFKLLRFVLGTAIANAVSNDVLLSADKGRAAGAATPHLADLQGKRIVWGSETKQGDKFNVSQVKHLTGGGGIPARKNYGDQYTFDPTHTLFLMTNYKPHADAKDKAFWSRVCLIEFNLRFVDKPQEQNERKADANLSKELEAEASGILAMLVRGCLEYQEQGLNRPEIVELSTESYRASEDNIQQYIEECCVCKDNVFVGAQKLYDTYLAWCKNNNLSHIDGKQFGKDISKRFVKVHKRSGWQYQKIGILTEETPPSGPKRDGSTEQCDGSTEHSSHPSEAASDETLDTTSEASCDGCDGLIQEVPAQLVREDTSPPLYGNTRHTRHTTDVEDTIKQPLEPNESNVTSQDSPVTSTFHPSHSLETYWAIGKQQGYPDIPDLGLKSGYMNWGSFVTFNRLRIPDVVARLGGVQ